jgi:hypothetical protein
VSATTPAIEFVLYSEDRADANQDFTVLREILLGMLKHLRADLKTNHVRITPVQPVRRDRICGSYWKVTAKATDPGAQKHRRNLIRDIATAIRLGRVVFFHVDADVIWSRRDACEHACEHWPRLCRDVEAVLARHPPSNDPPGQPDPLEQALVLAMPFCEMESWAFANTSQLRRILIAQTDLAALSDWEADLARLDEIADIKDVLTIKHSHNVELVQLKNGFPVAMLAEIPGSYAATLDRLRRSEIVQRGLLDATDRPF